MKRKIAAILAADVAEYSRLVAEGEEDTLARLMRAQAVFKDCVAEHGGRIFNTAGDAILVEFASAVEAARAALEIQERLRNTNALLPLERRLQFRMGLSIGDVVEHGTDLLGDGVNIAARLQTLSPPGGLAMSHWVQEQTAGKLPVAFRDIGAQSLKNIPSPVRVFVSGPASADVEVPHAPPHSSALSARLALVGLGVLVVAGLSVWYLRWETDPQGQTRPPPSEISSPAITGLPAPRPDERHPADTPVTPEPSKPADTAKPAKTAQPSPALAPPVPMAPPAAPSTAPTVEPKPKPAEPKPETVVLPAPRIEPAPIVVAPSPVAPPAATPSAPSAPTPTKPAPPQTATPQPATAAPPQPEGRPAETPADRKPAPTCREIMERAQIGDITPEDRAFLRSKCR